MTNQLTKYLLLAAASGAAIAFPGIAFAQTAPGQAGAAAAAGAAQEVIVVTGGRTFNSAEVSEAMIQQQTPLTSPLALIDNLPGVSIQEGDTFGFDDWSTTIAIRGFQSNLDEQQIGMTIDGLPNGNSNYGGGAKANRYIDTMNIGTVEVSQGTADVGSRSVEALGGTIDFRTSAPLDTQRLRFSASLGDFDAQRFYGRFDTGYLLDGVVKAWVSASHQEATDWVNGAAENRRDHFAGKIEADAGLVKLTGYMSYDDTQEDNYQQLFSAADFAANSNWDQLTDSWTGIPYIDQLYRRGWSTLRENFFTYLKADATVMPGLNLHAAGYHHKNEGRGDWVPPYIVDVNFDGAGNPQSEVTGGVRYEGGAPIGQIFFVDANGVALSPIAGCTSTITFPYGGAGAEYDPACYPAGAVAVQSYRHTHYKKRRTGVTADFDWTADFGMGQNLLRGGVWYEDTNREEWRDWHKITDTRLGFEYNDRAYWTQYSREYPQTIFKWYAEDQLTVGDFTVSVGVKQFLIDLKRVDLFDPSGAGDAKVDSDSDVLFSGGATWNTPLPGLQIFAGYAENFKSLGDERLETPGSDYSELEPETARNIEAGLRYNSGRVSASATYFNIEFDNRVIYLSANSSAGPDYLGGTNGAYFNGGGIESQGVELAATISIVPGLRGYLSYTYTDASYLGTGTPALDTTIDVTPGNQVVGIPENMAVASLDWMHGPYRAGISAKYTDERFVDAANSWAVDDYILADFYVGVSGDGVSDLLRGLDFSLTVNNLFDESYLGGITGGGAFIGAPRTTVFTVTADF